MDLHSPGSGGRVSRGAGLRVAIAACLTLAVLLVPLSELAQAAPTWLLPGPVSDPADPVQDTFTFGTRVAFDTQGNALAVWPRSVGPDQTVQASFRPAGGSFSPSANVSDVAPRCDACGL